MTCSAHDWRQSIVLAASSCTVGLSCAACQAAFMLPAAAAAHSGGGRSRSSAMPGYALVANALV